MKQVRVGLLAGFGINADKELARAFELAGAECEFLHLEELRLGTKDLNAVKILAFPGGFSFGDHLGSGKVLAHIVQTALKEQIDALLERGGLVLGICNGFQTLVKMGLLPNTQGDWSQEVSLVHNSGGTFLDRWVSLSVSSTVRSPWLRGIQSMFVPMRHGEGRLVLGSSDIAKSLHEKNLVAMRYVGGAPNGSWDDVAALVDPSGQVLGMMPHPECYLDELQRPDGLTEGKEPQGLGIFHNAVAWIREHHG